MNGLEALEIKEFRFIKQIIKPNGDDPTKNTKKMKTTHLA